MINAKAYIDTGTILFYRDPAKSTVELNLSWFRDQEGERVYHVNFQDPLEAAQVYVVANKLIETLHLNISARLACSTEGPTKRDGNACSWNAVSLDFGEDTELQKFIGQVMEGAYRDNLAWEP